MIEEFVSLPAVLKPGTAVTESDESDAAKILELLKNPETAALLKQLAKAL